MHGYTGTPETIEQFSELTDQANAQGVAVYGNIFVTEWVEVGRVTKLRRLG